MFYAVSLTTNITINKIITDIYVNLSGDNRDLIWRLTKNWESWGQWYPHARDVDEGWLRLETAQWYTAASINSARITTQAAWIPDT